MSVPSLPQEVIFDLPASLIGHRTYEYRAPPSNAQTFSTEGATIMLTLPRLDRSFWQTNTIYVRGRLGLTLIAAAAGADLSDPNMSFTSAGAYALFSRQVVRTGTGQTLETIANPGIITNIQMSYGLTPAERIGMGAMTKSAPFAAYAGGLATSAGWALASTIVGHNANVDFVLPLNSILTACEKFLPAGFDEFIVELTIANILSAASAQNPAFICHKDTFGISAFSMTDMEICAQVFELEPANYGQLMSSHPAGITLKSQSYVYGSGSLPAQSGAGTYDIVYPHKLQSIKQFIMAIAPTDAIEGPLYAGVNPNLSTYSLGINGVSYPQRPIRCVNPSETYAQNQKSYGALLSDLKCGSISLDTHAICSTAAYGNANMQQNYLIYGLTGARDLGDMVVKCNRCFFLLDLESLNGGKPIYNGVSTSGSGTSSVIHLEVGSQLANVVHNVHFFSVYDALLKFDPMLGVSVVN